MSERTIKLAGSFGFFGRNNDEKEQVLLALKRGTSTLLLPEEKLKEILETMEKIGLVRKRF